MAAFPYLAPGYFARAYFAPAYWHGLGDVAPFPRHLVLPHERTYAMVANSLAVGEFEEVEDTEAQVVQARAVAEVVGRNG